MSAAERLRELGWKFREAVSAGAFRAAQDILASLQEQVRELLQEVPPASEQAERLLREHLNALDWARRTVLAARAHDAARLGRLAARAAYRGEVLPARTLSLEG